MPLFRALAHVCHRCTGSADWMQTHIIHFITAKTELIDPQWRHRRGLRLTTAWWTIPCPPDTSWGIFSLIGGCSICSYHIWSYSEAMAKVTTFFSILPCRSLIVIPSFMTLSRPISSHRAIEVVGRICPQHRTDIPF